MIFGIGGADADGTAPLPADDGSGSYGGDDDSGGSGGAWNPLADLVAAASGSAADDGGGASIPIADMMSTLSTGESTMTTITTAAAWTRGVLIRTALASPSTFLSVVRYAEWRTVALVVATVVLVSAKLWGVGGGVLMTTYLKAPMEKVGIKFKSIKMSMLRFYFTLTDIELLPHESDVVRGILLAVYPSAHVLASKKPPPPSDDEDGNGGDGWEEGDDDGDDVSGEDATEALRRAAAFPGSRIRIASIGIRFSMRLGWFEPLSYAAERWSGGGGGDTVAKEDEVEDRGGGSRGDGGDEETGDAVDMPLKYRQSEDEGSEAGDGEDNNNDGGGDADNKATADDKPDAKVEAKVEAALPEALRPWYRKLALCGPVPKISIEIRGFHVEIDKAYLAPPPPGGIEVPEAPRPRLPHRTSSRYGRSSQQRGAFGGAHSTRSSLASGSVYTDESVHHIQLPPAALVPLYLEELYYSDVDDGDFGEDEYGIRDDYSAGDLEEMHRLPHFHQDNFLANMDAAGAIAADSLTFFIERWLDYTNAADESAKAAAAKRRKKDGGGKKRTKDEGGGEGGEGADADADAAASPSDSDGAGEKIRGASGDGTAAARNDDRTNSLLLSTLRTLLSSASAVAHDTRIVVTGVDGATIKRIRSTCSSPRLASVAFARLTREERASVTISATRLRLTFRGPECDAVVEADNLACVVRRPGTQPKSVLKTSGAGLESSSLLFRRKSGAASVETEQQRGGAGGKSSAAGEEGCQELIPPHHAILEVNGMLPFLIWSINYDHNWERRRLGASLTLPDRHLCVAPGALQTFMALMDDFVDPNSPFHEWHNWLSKTRLENNRLSDEDRQTYRECYVKARGSTKKAEGKGKKGDAPKKDGGGKEKNQTDDAAKDSDLTRSSKSKQAELNETAVVALEKRMTGDEIMEQRCLAMKGTWQVRPTNRELDEFLRSTESRIVPPAPAADDGAVRFIDDSAKFEDGSASPAQATATAAAAAAEGVPILPFRKIYTSPLEALVALVGEKFNLLAARQTIALHAGALSIQLINDGSFDSRAVVNTLLRLETIEVCVDLRSAIFSPEVWKSRPGERGGGGPEIASAGSKEPSTSAADVQAEIRKISNLTVTVQNAMWTPIETEIYEGLPSFIDGSLLGLLYELETSSPGPVLDLSLSSGVSLNQTACSDIQLKLDDAAVVFNPLPLFSSLGVLAAASELPFRDMDYERQLYGYPRAKAERTNGTLLNGANMSLSVVLSNVSLVIPTDITNLHKGCFEVNAYGPSLVLDSRDDTECIEFTVSSIHSYPARAYGTNDHGGRFLVNRLPFKQAFSVSDLEVRYRGQSFQKQKHGSLAGVHSHGKEAACEVGVDLRLAVGQMEGYSSPRINVQLLSCLESINKAQELLGGDGEKELMDSLIETQKSEEKYRLRHEALVELWEEADADGNNSLDRDEVEQVILQIFNSSSDSTNMFLGAIPKSSQVTNDELQREVRHFLNLADPHRDNDISFQEMDAVLYRKESISKKSMLPTLTPASTPKSTSEELIQELDRKFEFECCYETLCGLLYYDDLREYKNTAEVYRITGNAHPSKFPPTSLWRKGEGITLFWELYEKHTGCSMTSLNGQNMLVVQQKLVRVLLNYEFAKFCWKSLVGPGLRESAIAGKVGTTRRPRSTDWFLDNDPMATAMTKGVMDHLVRHVQQRTSDKQQELKDEVPSNSGGGGVQYIYSVHAEMRLDRFALGVGNGLAFSRPLIAVEAGPLIFEGNALLQPPSQGNLFVSSQQTEVNSGMTQEPSLTGGAVSIEGDRDESEPSRAASNTNNASFQALRLTVKYLNMTHDMNETSVEPFDIYGLGSYKSTKVASRTDDEQDEITSKTLEIFIPMFIKMNVSPSLLQTSDLVKTIVGNVDIEDYDKLFMQRHLENIQSAWKVAGKGRNQELTLKDLQGLFDEQMQSSKEAISRALAGNVATIFMKYIDTDGNGTASWDEVERVVRTHTLVFNPVSTRVHNRTGHVMHFCSGSHLEGLLNSRASASITDVTAAMNHIRDDKCSAVLLYKPQITGEISFTDKLVILIPGCKLLDKVPLTSYQSQMFPLRPLKRGQQRRRRGARKKKQRFGTGFEPYVTVMATSDKIDAITYSIRSSIVVKANTPIDVRVVCLPSALPFLRRRKERSGRKGHDGGADIDLSKKNFAFLLQGALVDAPIVFERQGIPQGDDVPLPISIFLSSSVHALLVRDLTTGGSDSQLWRKPVLLTKDFLLNTKHISEVVRCHAMSGITVARNRLNVYRSKKSSHKTHGEATKNTMKTAWDVSIHVNPCFALMNSLPFPIQFQSWQENQESVRDEWKTVDDDVDTASRLSDDELEDDSESWRRKQSFKKHTGGVKSGGAFYAFERLAAGGTVRLNGIDMTRILYVQVSQDCSSSKGDLSKLLWSAPISINLGRLRTAGKKSGSLSLPKIQGRLGDSVDIHVDVTVERDGTPYCTLFSPYWITNKTGMKLVYKLTGRETIYDAGVGGLPILAACNTTDTSRVGVAKREISVMPLESPKSGVASVWWDDATNGKLVIEPVNLKYSGKKRVEWSVDVGLDQAGSFGEIKCRGILFGVTVESLTGVFHRSNLVNISVRYAVKNILNIPVTIIPMVGLLRDVKKAARQLREEGFGPLFASPKHALPIRLEPSESTVLYQFRDLTKNLSSADSSKLRFICVRIEAIRWNDKATWHIIPVDSFGTTHYTEYDGIDTRLSGMVKVDIKQQGATTVLTLANPSHPPFLIENRSSTHYLQFVQDDPEGTVNEVPPMSYSGFAWCNPLGKKRLRFIAVKQKSSKEHKIEQTYRDTPEADELETDYDSISTGIVTASDVGQSVSVKTQVSDPTSNPGDDFVSRKRLFSRQSRSYDPTAVRKQQPLPCPSPAGPYTSEMVVEVHVLSGTRYMTFSDSDWRYRQIEDGLLRSGGDWKNTQCYFYAAGCQAHLTDDFPHEVISITLREIALLKPTGAINASAMLRHFQVDSMLSSSKYPVILRPIPMGVDRRDSAREKLGLTDSLGEYYLGGNRVLATKDQFWYGHDEQPFPVVEAFITYLPQLHMTWIPNLQVTVCPLKMQIDLAFCLRLADLVIDSLPEEDEHEMDRYTLNTISGVNKMLKYESGGHFGSDMTYVESLCIDATWVELDLDIKARDEDEDGEGDTMLALSSMGRSTKSQLSASLLSWLGNVASAFARVSPKFKFSRLTRSDTCCNAEDLAHEIQQYYVTQCIYQSYKVFFSMHMLGNPTQLVDQYKTGFVSLVTVTRDEIMAGGKQGFGKGAQSWFENVVGGTFTAIGKATGGVAEFLDSATTNEYTSKKIKPKATNEADTPSNIVEGFTHGTIFLGKAVIHGMVGVVGNPYRGLTEGGSASSVAKGVVSGVGGLIVAPFVGALGFTAKVTGGTGEMANITVSVIESRCRPSRVVRWGASIGPVGLPYLKAIGIRIHSVRYQRKYRGLQTLAEDDSSEGEDKAYPKNAKEFKKAKAEEEKRRMPPKKVLSVMRAKDKQHHLTAPARPMLLTDDTETSTKQQKVSKYLAVFEETIVIRRENLQLSDAVSINLWQQKSLKATTTKVKPIAQCRLTVGDMYVAMENYYQEMTRHRESLIMNRAKSASQGTDETNEEAGSAKMLDFLGMGMGKGKANENAPSESHATNVPLNAPSLQEFAMMKPVSKRSRPKHSNLAQAIKDEMAMLKQEEEDALRYLEIDSSDESSSDSSFEDDDRARSSDEDSEQAAAMEQLYGHVSVSFFPIRW